MCQRSRHLRNIRFDSNGDDDMLSESVLERFKHKSFQDFQSDRVANKKFTCHLCSIIRSVIECTGQQQALENNPRTPLTLALVRSGILGNVLWCFQFSLGDNKLDPWIEIASPSSDEYRDGFIEEFTLAKLVTRVPSASHLRLIMDWLKDCEENHSYCKMNSNIISRSQARPTRLIDLQDLRNIVPEPNIYLIMSADHEGVDKYVTLSHRWGGPSYELKQGNLGAMTQGIPLRFLPTTFREAMGIASNLGYRYIWIDSLCIIQDSRDDWNKESCTMATVYGNAVLNLAAMGESSATGCFRKRDHPLGRLPCKIPNTRHSVLYAQMHKKDILRYSSDRERSVLFSRAWVFQERMLSRRNIFLGGPELSWDCCTGQLSETYPKGVKYSQFSQLPLKVAMHATLETILDMASVSFDDAKTVFSEFWLKIVQDYSATDLTKEEDRPVALQGLVTTIQSRTGNRWTYIAGMWIEFLPVHLLWKTPFEATHNRQYSTTRPERWRQPSWSWWSLKHPIGVNYDSDNAETRKLTRCRRLLYRSTILGREVIEGGQTDALGFVNQAVLKLTGYIRNDVQMSSPNSIRRDGQMHFREVTLDFGLPASELVTLLLLTLRELDPVDLPNPYRYFESGLVLLPRESGEGYIRVGVFHQYYPEGYDDVLYTGNKRDEREVLLY